MSQCNNGHDLTPENTYVRPNGWKVCRTCRAEREQRRRTGQSGVANKDKVTCVNGHQLADKNDRGRRDCRVCAHERAISKRTGLPPGRPAWNPTAEDVTRIVDVIAAGGSTSAAAAAVGVSDRTLQRRCLRDDEFAAALAAARSARPTTHRYSNGCRCQDCRAVNAQQKRKWKESVRGRRDFEHGEGGYTNWDCRCPVCRGAHLAEMGTRSFDSGQWSGERHGYQWTGPELELVARADLSIAEVARRLGRTYNAVATQRHLIRRENPKTVAFL